VIELGAAGLDPLLFQCVFGRTIDLVENSEKAGERHICQPVSSDFVSHIVASFVFRRVVPLLLFDHFELAALAGIASVEGTGEKLNAFGQAFDYGEAIMIHRPLNHLNHVIDLGCVGPGNEGSAGSNQFFYRVNRMIDDSGRIGL
jgi:hypothetical protein